MTASHAPTAPLSLTVRRVFRASPAQVFDAWLDPAALGAWLFATPGGVMERVEVDPRVGGGFTVAERRGEALAEHFGDYHEITRPHRIVFNFRTDREEAPTRVSVDFAALGDRCLLTLTHTMEAQWAEHAERTRGGWSSILHGLAERVLDEPSLTITRTLDAPVSRVFAAWTRPEHLARWWGPANYTTPHVEMDFQEGGDWRTCMHGPNGEAYWSGGTYLEIVPDTRLVFTFAWDPETGMDPRNTLITVLFEDDHGKTRLTFHHAPFVDATDRDNHLGGWSGCLDRLVGEFS